MDSLLKILSLNVGTSASLAGLTALVETEDYDIIFLQENRLVESQIEQLLKGYVASANIDLNNPSHLALPLFGRKACK